MMTDQATVFLILAILIAFNLLFTGLLFRRLKAHHPKSYDRLGKPNLIFNNSVSNNILFVKFIVCGDWVHLDDLSLKIQSICIIVSGVLVLSIIPLSIVFL